MPDKCPEIETLPYLPELMHRFASAILGPIARATMLAIDHDTLLIQPTHSQLRILPRPTRVNGITGYPR